MPIVTLRHFTTADIAARTALLREPQVLANINDDAVLRVDGLLDARQARTIAEEQASKRIFTLCTRDEVVGFAWITSIDWRSQTCELSFGVLPRFRGGFGASAVAAAHEYIRAELNMQVVINQVLEHNTMLMSADELAAQRRVRCAYDSNTRGEWRTAAYWTETADDVRARREQLAQRRRDITARIRTEAERSEAERSA